MKQEANEDYSQRKMNDKFVDLRIILLMVCINHKGYLKSFSIYDIIILPLEKIKRSTETILNVP